MSKTSRSDKMNDLMLILFEDGPQYVGYDKDLMKTALALEKIQITFEIQADSLGPQITYVITKK